MHSDNKKLKTTAMKKIMFLLLIISPIFLTSACSKKSCEVCNVEPGQNPDQSSNPYPSVVPPSGEFYATTKPSDWDAWTVNGVVYAFKGNGPWQNYCHNFDNGYEWAPGQLPKGFYVTYHTDPAYFAHYGKTDKVIDSWEPKF